MKIIILLTLSLPCFATNLHEVIEYALKNAPQFKEERLATQSQLEALRKVFAIYDTQINLSHSYDEGINTQTFQNQISENSSLSFSKNVGFGVTLGATSQLNGRNKEKYQTSIKLSADIDLLQNILGKMDRSSVLIQEKDRKLLENALNQMEETLLYGVVQSYLNVTRLEKLLKENQKLNKNIQNLTKATKRKRKIGAVDERSVLQMEAKLINSNINILELERKLKASRRKLSTITGGGSFKKLSWPTTPNLESKKEQNLYLESLTITRGKIQTQKSLAKWGLLPKLSLGINYQMGDLDNSSYSYQLEENGKGLALNLSFPLGNTSAIADYKQYQLSLQSQKLTINREQEEFQTELEEYTDATTSYRKQIDLSKKVVTLQRTRYQQEMKAYTQGRSGINDINTAQNDHINSEIGHIEKENMFYSFIYGEAYMLSLLNSIFQK